MDIGFIIYAPVFPFITWIPYTWLKSAELSNWVFTLELNENSKSIKYIYLYISTRITQFQAKLEADRKRIKTIATLDIITALSGRRTTDSSVFNNHYEKDLDEFQNYKNQGYKFWSEVITFLDKVRSHR